MKDIDLNWLKEELEEWQDFYKHPADKKQHDFFSTLINAVDRLASTERERDELKERLSLVRDQRDAELNKNTQLEAEIARRDAAAGEPADRIVDDGCGQHIGGVGVSDRLNCVWPISTKFYTAAPPAVLPPAISTDGLDPESRDIDEVRNLAHIVGANWMRQRCLELGAQPQKPVAEVEELSMQIRRLVHSLKNSNPDSSLLKSVPDYMQRKGYWKATDCLRGEHD